MSAYGAASPTYENAELQKKLIGGRIDVARGIRDRAANSGDTIRAAKWQRTIDELLDRMLEVRGL